MSTSYTGELWKEVVFNFEFCNNFRLEVSNFGRLRTFNKISNGNIVNGSMINGYKIIRLKFFTARDENVQARLDYLQKEVAKLSRKIKSMKAANEDAVKIAESELLLNSLKKNLAKMYHKDVKERTIHHHELVHRLVAKYFLLPPTEGQVVVAHLDFDKLNNRFNNLKWMTLEESYAHQQHSPYVIQEKKNRVLNKANNRKVAKLTITRVMLLKKLINEGKPMKQLVKQFKITDTQILRIKRGENWADIEAAH